MAVKQLPTLSPIPESPNRLVGDQEPVRHDDLQ